VDSLLAYCGLDCHTCPIHVATLEMDAAKRACRRASVAALCREKYGMDISVEEVTDCDGCRVPEGRLFSGCARCTIRMCVQDRRLESCAYCEAYACELLRAQWEQDPEAEVRLRELRATMPGGGKAGSRSPSASRS
jgi:hypothetical protein